MPLLYLTGCTTFDVANLTASSQPRNDDGLYPVEMEIVSNMQALRRDLVKAYVVIGFDFYQMTRVPQLTNRFETMLPIGKDLSFVNYRFKVDYGKNEFGKVGKASTTSTEYKLTVTE